jgi:hypothetical protein
MASNSVEDILAQLKDRPVTRGWGAVAAFSRERLNAMLAEQFTASFNAANFLPPFSGEMAVDDLGTLVVTLDSLVFGTPTLSFETATLNSRTATLTIELIGGDCTRREVSLRSPPRLMSTARITEGMGFVLQMEIDLSSASSSIADLGRILISPLNNPRNPRCNLVEDTWGANRLGEYLLEHLQQQPIKRGTYVLGLLDASSHAPFSPVDFTILTHAAPGATVAGATNQGDGAVLVFMKLKGWANDDVSLPGDDASFPFLIPDDSRDGKRLHTAALLISHRLAHFVDDQQLGVLSASLLPEGYAFVESPDARHTPHDVVVFGRLSATDQRVAIEPLVTSVRNARSQQFTALDGLGNPLQVARWSAESIDRPLSSGSISATGLYRAVEHSLVGSNVLPTVVTAHYQQEGRQREASALVMARFESLNVAPLACTTSPGHAPVALVASSVGAGVLRWQLLAPGLGTLDDLGNGRALYTPPDAMESPLTVQRIEVLDESTGEAVQASVVLFNDIRLSVQPVWVGAMTGRGTHAFDVATPALRELLDTSGIPEDQLTYTWRLHGDGQVSPEGGAATYTPPTALSQSPVTVLECELSLPGGVTLTGFSVIEVTERQQEQPRWQGLNLFKLLPLQGVQAYANGMQQIPVRITIETSRITEDGVNYDIPISLVELVTLRLVDLASKSEVPFLESGQEGIEHDSGLVWATSDARNGFRPYGSSGPADIDPQPDPEKRTRRRDLYIHLSSPVTPEFFAQFTDRSNQVWDSMGIGTDDTIVVQGVAVPTPAQDDYLFAFDRAWDGEGDTVGDDIFSYRLESTDFWELSYRRAAFSSLKIDGNTSTIQYESELLNETFCSCTGWAFIPVDHRRQIPATVTGLSFDPYLVALFRAVSHAAPDDGFHERPPSPGDLRVSNHRLADLQYWYDGMAAGDELRQFRRVLNGPVKYILRDEDGNRHSLQIGYASNTLPDSRNELVMVRVQNA